MSLSSARAWPLQHQTNSSTKPMYGYIDCRPKYHVILLLEGSMSKKMVKPYFGDAPLASSWDKNLFIFRNINHPGWWITGILGPKGVQLPSPNKIQPKRIPWIFDGFLPSQKKTCRLQRFLAYLRALCVASASCRYRRWRRWPGNATFRNAGAGNWRRKDRPIDRRRRRCLDVAIGCLHARSGFVCLRW